MKLKQMKDEYFDGRFKAMAEAGKIPVPSLRNMISSDRSALELKDGRFILSSPLSIIFEIPKGLTPLDGIESKDLKWEFSPEYYMDRNTRPKGYYRIETTQGEKSIAYWGDFWLCHGDEDEYSDDELFVKSIEPIEI